LVSGEEINFTNGSLCTALNCDGIDVIAAPFIDEKFVKLIRNSNQDFCAFNVDNIEDAARLINLGVDSITTDSPLKMREDIRRYFNIG
jgi:glycerophosphoryl diester phosphodiesterase